MVRLGDVFKITSGGTPEKKKIEYYQDGTIPWVKTGDLKGMYVTNNVECITELGLKNSSAKVFPQGTVLLAMYGATIGACSILSYDASTNQACAAFLPSDKFLPEYLYYLLTSKKEKFIKDGVGGAQPNISAGYLKDVEIEQVSIEAQKEIVSSLSKVEIIIANRQQQLQKLDELVKARFVEIFGDQSKNENAYERSNIGEVADIFLGLTYTPNYVDEGIKFLSAKNTSCDYLNLEDVKFISKEEYEKAPKGAKPKKGDVLFSRVGSNLGHPVILDIEDDFCIFVSLGFLRAKGRVTNIYLKHWMRDDFFNEQVKRSVVGGGQPNLNTGWLKEFSVLVPPMKLQEAFSLFVTQIDKSKLSIQKSLGKLETLKKGLMQKYFG